MRVMQWEPFVYAILNKYRCHHSSTKCVFAQNGKKIDEQTAFYVSIWRWMATWIACARPHANFSFTNTNQRRQIDSVLNSMPAPPPPSSDIQKMHAQFSRKVLFLLLEAWDIKPKKKNRRENKPRSDRWNSSSASFSASEFPFYLPFRFRILHLLAFLLCFTFVSACICRVYIILFVVCAPTVMSSWFTIYRVHVYDKKTKNAKATTINWNDIKCLWMKKEKNVRSFVRFCRWNVFVGIQERASHIFFRFVTLLHCMAVRSFCCLKRNKANAQNATRRELKSTREHNLYIKAYFMRIFARMPPFCLYFYIVAFLMPHRV